MEKVTEKEGVVGRGAGTGVVVEGVVVEGVVVKGLGEGVVEGMDGGRGCGGRRPG